VVVSSANVKAIDGRFRPTCVAADAAARRQDQGDFGFEKHSNVISLQKRGAAELCR
jgi:hypothetical protein